MQPPRSRERPMIRLIALSVWALSLSLTASAQQARPEGPSNLDPPAQAPPEKPSCGSNEVRVGDECVERAPRPPINGQTAPETPPTSAPPPSERIPVCKKGQVVRGDKCVDGHSRELPPQ